MTEDNFKKMTEKEVDELWERIRNDIDAYEVQQQKKKRIRTWFSVASIAIIAIVASTLFMKVEPGVTEDNSVQYAMNQQYNYQTGDAERTVVNLPDGSKMWLNAHTKAYIPDQFTGDTREVTVDGEAYFEVVHDSEHPFIVNSHNAKVEVLGTKFSVKDRQTIKESSVVLVSGSVMVDAKNNGSRIKLQPNQRIRLHQTEFDVENVRAEELVSWTKGLYTFNDEDLAEILKELASYYGVKVKFDRKIDIPFSGKIDLGDSFDNILKGFGSMNYLEYNYVNGCYIIH